MAREGKILYGRGLSSLHIGDDLSKVKEVLGPPDSMADFDDVSVLAYPGEGIQVNYDWELSQVTAMFFFNGPGGKPGYAVFEGSTDRGIDWSSTAEDCLVAYGSPLNDFKSDDPRDDWRRLVYPGIGFRFESGRLLAISVPGP